MQSCPGAERSILSPARFDFRELDRPMLIIIDAVELLGLARVECYVLLDTALSDSVLRGQLIFKALNQRAAPFECQIRMLIS